MNRRFWCILCSAFLAYNLKVLFDDLYSVNYKIVEVEGDDLHDEVTKVAVCTHPSKIVENNRKMEDKAIELKQMKMNTRIFLNTSIAMIENRLNTKNLFSLDQSYYFREFVCFLLNQTAYGRKQELRKFFDLYNLRLFAYSLGKQPFFFEYILVDTMVFSNHHYNGSLHVRKQKVYGPQYLASSNCRTHRDQFLASRFNCLRKCNFSWPTDFHPPDSDKLLVLNDLGDKQDYSRDLTSRSHFEKESDKQTLQKCIEKCPRDDCFSETYNSVTVKNSAEEMKINIESKIYRAYYSTTQFWCQLFGLLTLFTSASVIDTVPHLMSLAAKKLKASHQVYFVRFLPRIKFGLIILSSIFILVQSILMIADYRFEKNFPNKTIIWNFSSKSYSVHICLPVETLIFDGAKIEQAKNSRILASFTFEQLEKKSRAFENGVEEIKLLHGNQIKNLSWTLAKKVLFKNSSFNGTNCLSRCFRIEPKFRDLKYRKMMPFHYLIIRFRTKYREVYLTEKHQNFSSELVNFKGDYFVRKMTEKSLPTSRKSNCREMKASSKREKIDRCINQRFIRNHSALPVRSVVDRDDFGDEINDYKFEETDTTSIERDCMATYSDLKACEEVRFEESMKIMDTFHNTIKLNLNYEESISQEIDQSFIKVVLSILNLESIFFKNNVASCLLFILAALKRTFKLNWSNGKITQCLVFFVCLLGFLTHNVFVFKGIVDEELVQNGYFKVMRQFTIPNPVFCFDLSKLKSNENEDYNPSSNFRNLTKELQLGKIISEVTYFNRTHYNKVMIPNLVNLSNSELTIKPFCLLDFYCAEVQLNVKFNEEDFYILLNKFVLSIYFDDAFTKLATETHLFYKQPGPKREVSDLLRNRIGPNQNGKWPVYEIVLELIEVDRQDDFEDWKDLRRLFFGKRRTEDVNDYLSEMEEKFRAGHLKSLTTNEILLEHANFSKEIDNEMFKKFFLQVTNVTDHQQPTSLNSNRIFFNFYSQLIDDYFTFTFFQFTILPTSKRVEILNNENYAKLIQDILNCLSLWLNISITDLVVHINWILSLFLKVYSLLSIVRDKLGSLDCFS